MADATAPTAEVDRKAAGISVTVMMKASAHTSGIVVTSTKVRIAFFIPSSIPHRHYAKERNPLFSFHQKVGRVITLFGAFSSVLRSVTFLQGRLG